MALHNFMYHELARLSPVLREMGSENAHGCAQTQRMASALTFLEPYHKDGNEYLSHTAQVKVMKPGFHL
jgi:hypothetical protein